MKKLRRLGTVLMAGVLSLSFLAGCNGGQSSQGNENKDNQKQNEPGKQDNNDSDGKKIELKFYSWETNFAKELETVVDEYNKQNEKVHVNIEFIGDNSSSEYLKKIDLNTMGNEEMDVVMQPSFALHSSRAISGAILPLDDYMKAEGVTMGDEYIFETPVNGKFYGFPAEVKSWYVLLNKDHLDDAGLAVPSFDWTWEDYKDYSVKLTKGEGANKIYGSFMQATNDRYNYLPLWVEEKGNPYFKDDGSLNFDSPLLKSFMEFRKSLEQETKSQVPYADVKSLKMNYRDQFFGGKISMLVIGSYTLPDIRNQEKYPHDFVTTFAPIPRWNKDAKPGATITESHYYSISKNSKHPQETYDFLRWFTTDGMKLFHSGVSAQKGTDRVQSLLAGLTEEDKKYYDLDALNNLFNNENWTDNFYTFAPAYQSQLETLMKEEAEKYLLDQQDIDTTIDNLMTKGQKIQDEASK